MEMWDHTKLYYWINTEAFTFLKKYGDTNLAQVLGSSHNFRWDILCIDLPGNTNCLSESCYHHTWNPGEYIPSLCLIYNSAVLRCRRWGKTQDILKRVGKNLYSIFITIYHFYFYVSRHEHVHNTKA